MHWVGETHADGATGTFNGTPYEATKRCTTRGNACGRCRWSLRWDNLWGHDTLNWAGETHADGATAAFGGLLYAATKRCTGWGRRMRAMLLRLRWNSLWGHETLNWVGETHATSATGTFGGAPYRQSGNVGTT